MQKQHRFGLVMGLLSMGLGLVAGTASADIYPPWSQGKNNPVTERGLEFTVPKVWLQPYHP